MSAKPPTQREQTILSFQKLNPHPDGHPWPKCCGEKTGAEVHGCMCLMRKPVNGFASRFENIMSPASILYSPEELQGLIDHNERFFCVHRTDGEYHRECAGWAAKFTHNK